MSEKELIKQTLDCLFGAINNVHAICKDVVDHKDGRLCEAEKALRDARESLEKLHEF